jgi:hypothetical protein
MDGFFAIGCGELEQATKADFLLRPGSVELSKAREVDWHVSQCPFVGAEITKAQIKLVKECEYPALVLQSSQRRANFSFLGHTFLFCYRTNQLRLTGTAALEKASPSIRCGEQRNSA